MSPLDHPLWVTLTGPHAAWADLSGSAARFRPDVSTLAALAPDAGSAAWTDLHGLLAPGEYVALFFFEPAPPFPPSPELRVVYEGDYDQMVCTDIVPTPESPNSAPPMLPLSVADASEMVALVDLTEPGPFALRTGEVGRYLGIRNEHGELVAMAGERSRIPGFVEISAVCTHPDYRGRGLRRSVGARTQQGCRCERRRVVSARTVRQRRRSTGIRAHWFHHSALHEGHGRAAAPSPKVAAVVREFRNRVQR